MWIALQERVLEPGLFWAYHVVLWELQRKELRPSPSSVSENDFNRSPRMFIVLTATDGKH